MLNDSFMKNGYLLLPNRLFKYVLTILTWWINRLNIKYRAKYIYNYSFITIGINVFIKLMPNT